MEHFSMFSYVFKSKELGLILNANDFDVEQINIMYEILSFAKEREQRKVNGRKT